MILFFLSLYWVDFKFIQICIFQTCINGFQRFPKKSISARATETSPVAIAKRSRRTFQSAWNERSIVVVWLESSGKAGAKPVTADRLITNHPSHLSHSRKPREPISKIRKKRIILDTFDTSIENNCRERVTKLLLLVDHVGREKQNTSYFIRIS